MKRIINHLLTLSFAAICLVVAGGFIVDQSKVMAKDPLSDVCSQVPAGAAEPAACQASGKDPLTKAGGEDGIIIKATKLVIILTGIASVFMIMIGGFKYVTSSGDPGNIQSAKNTIIYALVGLAIAALAQTIVVFVLQQT